MGVVAGERLAPPLSDRGADGRGDRGAPLAVAALTAIAFALRYAGLRQSLFGDELFTYAVAHPGLGGLVDRIQAFELNPPLFFVLAALAAKLGDPTELLRLPSLLLGTASVPLLYLLGARTVGRGPGLIACAVLAISPFAVFYGTEARAYATLLCLVLLSTLLLLEALDRGRARWWVAFAVVGAAALYTHYTAVFPLAGQFAWAMWRREGRRRAVLASYVVVGLAFVPWIPYLRGQGDTFALLYRLSPRYLARSQLNALFGHPFVGLDRLLGHLGQWLIAGVLLAGASVGVARTIRGRGWSTPSDGLLLVFVLAIVTPVGMLADYAIGGGNLISPRNLTASLPGALLLIGVIVAALPRWVAVAGTVVILAVLAVGTGKLLDGPFERPGFRAAAQLVDARAGRGVPVLESPYLLLFSTVVRRGEDLLLAGENPLRREVRAELRRPHDVVAPIGFRRGAGTITPLYPPAAWRRGRQAGAVWVIAAEGYPLTPREVARLARFVVPRPPAGTGRWRLATRRHWPGLVDVVAIEYVPVRS